MRVVLKRVQKPIKNGWSSESPALQVAAHGFSREAADENLRRTARLFLAPFQREGVLDQEAAKLGLRVVEGGDELEIVLE